MAMVKKIESKTCDEPLHERGFRFTAQRREVYDALLARRDHPTAIEVFMRVKEKMPSISLGTVYNCLETLSACGLVKHVNLDRAPSRYCPNIEPHAHFFCDQCGTVLDVPLRKDSDFEKIWDVPPKTFVTHHEATFRGLCPDCAAGINQQPKIENLK